MRAETNHRDQNNQANGRKQNRIIKSHAVMLAASHGFVKSWFLQLLQLLQRAHLGTTTIVEASRSLSLRGTSGERAGERGTFHRIGAANWNPLSLLLCRGERESSTMVVVPGCTPFQARKGRSEHENIF